VADGGAVQLTMQLEIDVAQSWHSGQYACVAVNPLSGDVIISKAASVGVYGKFLRGVFSILTDLARMTF